MSYEQTPLMGYDESSEEELIANSEAFFNKIRTRRTVRHFSKRPVPKAVIETCIKAAGTAPSGANQQPWQFVVVQNAKLKKLIKEAAEKEEKQFYEERASEDWLKALAPLGTDWKKPFLEIAPFLIAIFYKNYDVAPDGSKIKIIMLRNLWGLQPVCCLPLST